MAMSRGAILAQQQGVKPEVVIEVKVKSDREKLIEELEAKGIEFKKNSSTKKLQELLGE